MARLMLATALALACLTAAPAWGERGPGVPCGVQDYDAEEAPDFSCPGPEEESLRPDLRPPDAVPVRQGWRLMDTDGELVGEVEWDGALVHRDKLIELGLWVRAVRRLRWADRLRLRREYDIRLQHAEEVGEARARLIQVQRDSYRDQWLAAQRQLRGEGVWYRTWWFGVIVGVVVTGALVALTAYALHAVSIPAWYY